jgi:hypothetical protein
MLAQVSSFEAFGADKRTIFTTYMILYRVGLSFASFVGKATKVRQSITH